MTLSVHQVVPVLSEHDATGQHTRQVQRLLGQQGLVSEIYAGHVVPGADGWAKPLKEMAGADVLLTSAPSARTWPRGAWTRRAAGRQLPQHDAAPYFNACSPTWLPCCARAVKLAARRAALGIADSRFNADG